MSDSNTNGDGPVVVRLDSRSVLTLMAGGAVELPMVNVRLESGGDLARLIWQTRTRVNAGRVTQKPLPAKGD